MFSMGKWAQCAVKGVGASLLLGLLASCGGGTEQVEEFSPTRYIAFGDELSVLTKQAPQGRKYTVNAVAADGTSIDCASNSDSQPARLWTQILAATFDFVFAECNPSARSVQAFSYAEPGAKAGDFEAQLAAARVVHGPFGCKDLMSLVIGANDVLELFQTVYLATPTSSTADAVATELSARGARLGRAITRLTDNNGPSIVVSTMPLMNLTPYARELAALRPEIEVQSVLRRFSDAFNTALRVNIPNDGSRWGLVELDAILNAGSNNPEDYQLDNVTRAVCRVDLPDCSNTALDLVADGNPRTWLWASDLWMGWEAHERLGSFARTRARDNPFGCS